jgi:hypothetical protein
VPYDVQVDFAVVIFRHAGRPGPTAWIDG